MGLLEVDVVLYTIQAHQLTVASIGVRLMGGQDLISTYMPKLNALCIFSVHPGPATYSTRKRVLRDQSHIYRQK